MISIFCFEETAPFDRTKALLHCAEQFCSDMGWTPGRLNVERTVQGKPFFPDMPQVGFSISHSSRLWVCAFAPGAVGVDVERIRSVDAKRVARRMFHPQEQEYLAQKNWALWDFFSLWTAKEAAVKRTGEGIGGGFSRFSVVQGQCLARCVLGGALFQPAVHSEFCLSVCTDYILNDDEIIAIEHSKI